jgi:hypothetical protein
MVAKDEPEHDVLLYTLKVIPLRFEIEFTFPAGPPEIRMHAVDELTEIKWKLPVKF